MKVPLNLQNRSLRVQGRIRVIRDEDESSLDVQVLEALEKESGWRFNEHGLLVGSLLTSRFVDPSHSRSGRITRVDENHFGEKRKQVANA